MPELLDRFRAHVDAARLLRRRGAVVVAVSGGPDSVALLDLLASVAGERGLDLVVAHADHGMRADSRAGGQAVRALAERYGLPFELGELHLGPDASETEARGARYAWLRAVQRRRHARYLVTAHHQDDQIETVLLRALRGTAPAGLAGIAARSRGGLVRPLLPFTRAELAAYARARGLPAHDDPANRDPRHLRSWVRTVLLPLLGGRLGARIGHDLVRLGRQAARDRRAWDRALELVPELDVRTGSDGFDVARGVLARYDDALGTALLRALGRRVGLVLGPARARRLAALLSGRSGRRVELSGGWEAEAAFDRLRVSRARARKGAQVVDVVEVVAEGERGSARFGPYRVAWRPAAVPERMERTGWTTWVSGAGWQVRAPHTGDRVQPLGGVGRRALRRLLMEARVPRSERAAYPVLARGETILWVPGICRSGAELPPPGTRAVRVDVTDNREPEADRRA